MFIEYFYGKLGYLLYYRGSEKRANLYAKSFIDAYRKITSTKAEDVVATSRS
jgi:hypothetical protein